MTVGGAIRRLAACKVGRTGPLELIALVPFGLFLGAIQPFDSVGPALPRYIYWQLAIVGGGVIGALIEPLVYRAVGTRPRLFALAQLMAMTPAISVWVSLVPALFFGMTVSGGSALEIMPNVLIINTSVVILAWLMRKATNRRDAISPIPEGLAPPVIRARLPPRLARSRLVAVEAEDHYLRVRTEAGSALVLMRLVDALEALSGLDGFRTHRSWWVARTAVQAMRWKGGRGDLTLSDGSSAPVSRTYAAVLKGTDWAAPVS